MTAERMRERHVLVIASGPACRNPRPLKEALALVAAGMTVTLLSLFETEAAAVTDDTLLSNSGINHVRIRLPHNALARFGRRLQGWLARKAVQHIRYESAAALGPCAQLLKIARRIPADLTIVHNEAPFWVGCRLLDDGQRVAADFEDWYSEDLLPEARRGRPLRLLRQVERTLIQRAVYTTTTSGALAQALADAYSGTKPRVITNSFPLQPGAAGGITNDPPKFFWFSQTVGPGRGLEEFLTAWGHTTHASRVVLLGDCSPTFRAHLLELVPPAVRQCVSFEGLVSPSTLPSVIAAHDIGLALEHSAPPSRDLTITNKILQYLNAGLAVVATDTSGQREVFARGVGIGQLVSLANAPQLTKTLDALLADRGQLMRMKQSARRAAEEIYCWEKQSPAFVALVQSALAH